MALYILLALHALVVLAGCALLLARPGYSRIVRYLVLSTVAVNLYLLLWRSYANTNL